MKQISFTLFSIAFICAWWSSQGFSPAAGRPTFIHRQSQNRPTPTTTAFPTLPFLRGETRLRESLLEKVATGNVGQISPFTTNSTQETQSVSPIEPEVLDEFDKRTVETTTPAVKEDGKGKLFEIIGLGTWISGLSSFLIINNYVGPWPGKWLASVPVEYFGATHALAGMLFGGGIILTTLIEWLAVDSKNASVLKFWFSKVPALDSLVVLPALTASIVSGVGLAVDHYDSLGQSPPHVIGAISTLLAFAVWWATTDLTTQGSAATALEEWTQGNTQNTDIPRVIQLRKISNVVSCTFVAALYLIMVLKPGS